MYELVIKDLSTGKNLPDSVKKIAGCAALYAFGVNYSIMNGQREAMEYENN